MEEGGKHQTEAIHIVLFFTPLRLSDEQPPAQILTLVNVLTRCEELLLFWTFPWGVGVCVCEHTHISHARGPACGSPNNMRAARPQSSNFKRITCPQVQRFPFARNTFSPLINWPADVISGARGRTWTFCMVNISFKGGSFHNKSHALELLFSLAAHRAENLMLLPGASACTRVLLFCSLIEFAVCRLWAAPWFFLLSISREKKQQ